MKKETEYAAFGQMGVGLAVGFSTVIPGLPFHDLAIASGQYRDMVSALTGKKGFWKFLLLIAILFVTFILGIFALSIPAQLGWNEIGFGMMLLSIGLSFFALPFTLYQAFKTTKGLKRESNPALLLLFSIIGAGLGVVVGYVGNNSLTQSFLGESNFEDYLVLLMTGAFLGLSFFIPGFSGTLPLLCFGYLPQLIGIGEGILHSRTVDVYLPELFFLDFCFVLFTVIFALLKSLIAKKHKVNGYLGAFGSFFTIAALICYCALNCPDAIKPFLNMTAENDIKQELWSYVGLGVAGLVVSLAVAVVNFYRSGVFKAEIATIKSGEKMLPGEIHNPRYDSRSDFRYSYDSPLKAKISPTVSPTMEIRALTQEQLEAPASTTSIESVENLLKGEETPAPETKKEEPKETAKTVEKKPQDNDLAELEKMLKGE